MGEQPNTALQSSGDSGHCLLATTGHCLLVTRYTRTKGRSEVGYHALRVLQMGNLFNPRSKADSSEKFKANCWRNRYFFINFFIG